MTNFIDLRQSLGLTETEVQDVLDISRSRLKAYEEGSIRPSPAEIQALKGYAAAVPKVFEGPTSDQAVTSVEGSVIENESEQAGMQRLLPFERGRTEVRKKTRAPESKLVSRKPRLLDLFCCAGGAGVGYARAGFEVVGVDITPQPNNPHPFIQTDALKLDPKFIALFDAIHASPPCQSYSDLAKRNRNADEWPRLIEPVREMLKRSGLPYVIENVEGAPLQNPIVLCGTMFPKLRVLRHRLFEANFEIVPPPHKKHPKVHTFDKRKSHFGKTDEWKDFVQVTGGGNCSLAAARHAMGIDWMTKGEINEAIPPAYTEFIGRQLLQHLAMTEISAARRTG
ncbi:MAG TPA: DNA cytosine methyltransferase [Rhizomicrobium sp.]|nr:DNA cytosine methyltransferase [Rhizomicrobium sp.]